MDYDENYEKKYYSDIVESAKFIKKDKSVKTIEQAWKRLKQEISEFAEKNNLVFRINEFTADEENEQSAKEDMMEVYQVGKWGIFIAKLFREEKIHISDSSFHIYGRYDFKEYNCILFILYWYIKIPTEKNIELLHKTREQMELDYLKNKKIEEANSAILNSCLDALCKENNLKYTIDEDSTSCIITFRLRPYYRLQVKLLYSEFSTQLAELKDVLQKAMEISDSSLGPIISCNWEY